MVESLSYSVRPNFMQISCIHPSSRNNLTILVIVFLSLIIIMCSKNNNIYVRYGHVVNFYCASIPLVPAAYTDVCSIYLAYFTYLLDCQYALQVEVKLRVCSVASTRRPQTHNG